MDRRSFLKGLAVLPLLTVLKPASVLATSNPINLPQPCAGMVWHDPDTIYVYDGSMWRSMCDYIVANDAVKSVHVSGVFTNLNWVEYPPLVS